MVSVLEISGSEPIHPSATCPYLTTSPHQIYQAGMSGLIKQDENVDTLRLPVLFKTVLLKVSVPRT